MTTVNATGNALGKDAFLQLMVTQMRYQDPLQPQDNSQFIAQLAQFSSLEQMTNIAQGQTQQTTQLQGLQTMTQLTFEHQLVGTSVRVTDATGATMSGTVSAIKFVSGEPLLVVNGTTYPLSSLSEMG